MSQQDAQPNLQDTAASPEKMELTSLNIADHQKQKLKELFPEVFTEGNKIDFDQLKRTLGEMVDGGKERFGMQWAGKADCFKTIQQPSLATLVPCSEESIDFDTTENVFIEGDNLEVLKLLQKSYLGKIKMIYIDPPYNTGKDFIYPDNYSENLDTYLEYTGQIDGEGRKFSTNTDTDGRFHSKWMNMMYPRLFLAKNLLREDGVIFISIDNDEVHNLRALANEIFGEENFIECISWNKRVPKNDKGIGNIHEFILIYVKDKEYRHEFTMPKEGLEDIDNLLKVLKKKKVSLSEAEKEVRSLFKKKGYDRGITLYNNLNKEYRLWGKINMSWPNANTFGSRYDVLHPRTGNPVKVPDRGWRWKKETFENAANYSNGAYQNIIELDDGTFICDRIWFDKDEKTQPSSINFLDEIDTLLLRSVLSLKSDGGIEIERIFDGKNIFPYPKPTTLLKMLFQSPNFREGIILDFFSGSGTTAHAVMDLNKEDGGNRKYICIQLPETIDEKSEAFKAGFKTIAEISKERIRRASAKIKEESGSKTDLLSEQKAQLDLGFRVFKLQKSNFSVWDSSFTTDADQIALQLDQHVDHISPEAEQQAILFELLLKAGFELTTPIDTITLADKTVYSIAEGALLICLEKQLTLELMHAIADCKPARVIVLDEGFQNNDQLKTNASLTLKSKGILDFRTV